MVRGNYRGIAGFTEGLENWWNGNLDWERQQIMFEQQTNLANTAYQRAVNDMKQAGLNPALMYGSGGAATTPSPSSQHSSSGAGQAVMALVNTALDVATKGTTAAIRAVKGFENTAKYGNFNKPRGEMFTEKQVNKMVNTAYELGRMRR